ncbi:MAG TPA: response regulator transcription factor [Acidimicrobiales bacterium]|nr:response regulator transcription factor [Acidimicrobiales bacterium]
MTSESLRLVVVDDEPDVLLLLRLQLSALPGLEVVGTAADGEEAVEVCRRLRPDAVVMDLLLPVSSGFRAVEVLQHEHPDMVIVAYSAVAGDWVRSEMARLGVPLVLKSGDVRPLVDALFAGARVGDD